MKRRKIINLLQCIVNEQFHIFNRLEKEKEGTATENRLALLCLAETNQAMLTLIEQGLETSKKEMLKLIGPMDWLARFSGEEVARNLDGSPVSEEDTDAVHSLVDYRKEEGLCIEVDVIGKEKNGKSTIALAIMQHLEALGIAAKFDDFGDDTADAVKFINDQEARLQSIKDQKVIVTIRTVMDSDEESAD